MKVVMKKDYKNGFNENMRRIFQIIEKNYLSLNWLITDFECNYIPDTRFNADLVVISGVELIQVIRKNSDLQFYWGVFSGFLPDCKIDFSNQNDLPYADGNSDVFLKDAPLQHPLAVIEVVAFDGDQVVITCSDDKLGDLIEDDPSK